MNMNVNMNMPSECNVNLTYVIPLLYSYMNMPYECDNHIMTYECNMNTHLSSQCIYPKQWVRVSVGCTDQVWQCSQQPNYTHLGIEPNIHSKQSLTMHQANYTQ
jgi:hypothetical protein